MDSGLSFKKIRKTIVKTKLKSNYSELFRKGTELRTREQN